MLVNGEQVMAKYIMIPNQNMFTYALDECEDYVTSQKSLEAA